MVQVAEHNVPQIPQFRFPEPTKADLDYADIPIIDFAPLKCPGITLEEKTNIRQALASQLHDIMTTCGFFYIVGHGYTEEKINRMFSIADLAISGVPDEEKAKYEGKMEETGSYQGYKLRNYWHIDNGVRDQIEHYNIHKNVNLKEHPTALRPFLPEISAFSKFCHVEIIHEVLRLFEIGLGLPEDELVGRHGFDAEAETWVRFMKYYPRSTHDEMKTKNVWLKGHTDGNSITVLWSQPVAALQVMSPDGQWRYVRHIPNSVVINAGDPINFLTDGKYKATIHRVVQPPPDQQALTRLGVFYFCCADDDVKLVSLLPGNQDAVDRIVAESESPTMGDWRRKRIASYGRIDLTKGKEAGIEEQFIHGRVLKHYN